MRDKLNIRPLRAEDEDHWRRLWTGYLDYYETRVDEAVYEASFARLLGNGERDFNGFIATIDETPVGLVHFLFHRHMWKIEDTCCLQDLYTDPDCRGRGVARALIEAVYAAADRAGAPSVYWLTQDFNTRARALYDKVGTKTPFIRYNRA